MIYLRETIYYGLVLYKANEAHTEGTIIRILKQNTTHNKKKLLHINETLVPFSTDMEFQTEEEAVGWVCLNEL